jgi:hypothetical protein
VWMKDAARTPASTRRTAWRTDRAAGDAFGSSACDTRVTPGAECGGSRGRPLRQSSLRIGMKTS